MQSTIFRSPTATYTGAYPEKLITIGEAADALGVAYWQVQRAVKRGDIPSYAPFNSRRLVRLSEVVEFVEASRQGGVE